MSHNLEHTFLKIGGQAIRIKGRLIRTASLDGDKFEFPDDPDAVAAGLRNCGDRVDLFTFYQPLPDTAPRYPYPMEWDNFAVLPVSTYEHWWNKQIRSYPRNRARQAEKKGVVVREIPFDDALLRGICEIYNECPIRQGRRFPHYGMTFERARGHAGTFLDRSIFIGALLGSRLIGFAKLVINETQACLIHILSMNEHKDKAPTNALLSQAVRSCAERGIGYLVYEHFAYGKRQGDSLSHFKEVNGFVRMNVPHYCVPLTVWGKAGFRLGLHRGLADHVPESIAFRLRALRYILYSHKFKALAEV